MGIKRPRAVRGMVTRAFTLTELKVRCYDSVCKTELIKQLSIDGRYASNAQMLDKIRADKILDDTIIPLEILASETRQQLRAMSKADFFKYSEIIDYND